ncbi:hypothetical protein ZIOFF_003921 [Zingiber officinale]|uniref:dUTP diphosphatase n=1 Tax=Zingiber officinale TaxID=94328 RepID=A0A8J5HZ89_ZINOF|nr:hypothetical protein ZIOFF_003921 [Zingiber officinale]
MQPTEVNTQNLLDGCVSIHFDSYQATITANPPHYNQRDEEIPSDEEEVEHQVIAVLLQNPEVLQVKRISNTTILPQRKTEGSVGYDLAINREQFVPKKDRSLLTTGICIQIPKGTYARVAPRSSATLRGLIIMGGVIDEDHRGEVKIIAYNITNKHVYLQKHECIAQIILEKITTPDVVEIACLEPTERGMQGFGSTTNLAYPTEAPLPHVCTRGESHPECPGCAYCHDGKETAEPYGCIDDREYIEYMPLCHQKNTEPAPKEKQTFDAILEEYQHFHQEYDWLQRRAMTFEDDPMEIAISETRLTLRRSRDYQQELQQQIDALSPSSSTNHFCMTITTNHTPDGNVGILQELHQMFVFPLELVLYSFDDIRACILYTHGHQCSLVREPHRTYKALLFLYHRDSMHTPGIQDDFRLLCIRGAGEL